MRKFIAVLLLLIFAVPALGDDITQPVESVTVNNDSLAGIWKFTMPLGFDFSFFHKTKWGPQGDAFCQIEEIQKKLTVHCLGFRLGVKDVSHGSLSMKGRNLRMVWGSARFYAAINGTQQSATQFDGIFSVQALGVSDDAPDKVVGTKLALVPSAPDKGEKLHLVALILDGMAKGALTVPLDPKATGVRILNPDTLRQLGDVRSIIYVGEKGNANTALGSVYDIEFANGHLICSLHQTADNKLDQFDCG
jgi:hypothetical protein